MADRPTYVWSGSEWDVVADPGAIRKTLIDAKGDLVGASANDTPVRVPVGSNDTVLVADSSQTPGIKWATLNSTQVPVTVQNAQTGSYTLVIGDAGKLVEMGSGSAITLTIPLNSSVAFPVGTRVDVLRTGTGEVSIAGTGGVTVNSEGSKLRINAQWQAVSLVKRATDTWVVIGALKT